MHGDLTMDKIKKFTLRLDEETHNKINKLASITGMSLNEFFLKLVENATNGKKDEDKWSKPSFTDKRKIPPFTAASQLRNEGWSPTALCLAYMDTLPEAERTKLEELWPAVKEDFRKWKIALELKKAEKEIVKNWEEEIKNSPRTVTKDNFYEELVNKTVLEKHAKVLVKRGGGGTIENDIKKFAAGESSWSFYFTNPVERTYMRDWFNHNGFRCVINEGDFGSNPYRLQLFIGDWKDILTADMIFTQRDEFLKRSTNRQVV